MLSVSPVAHTNLSLSACLSVCLYLSIHLPTNLPTLYLHDVHAYIYLPIPILSCLIHLSIHPTIRGLVTLQLVNQRANRDHIQWQAVFDGRAGDRVASRMTGEERAPLGVCKDNFIMHSDLHHDPAWLWDTEYLKDDCLHFRIVRVKVKSCVYEMSDGVVCVQSD